MEDTTIAISRLRNKKKWAYSFHSLLSIQTEEYLKNTNFEIQQLGKLVAEISDGLHSTRHYVDDGIVMLAVRNITEFGLDLSNKKMIAQAEHEHLERSQVQPGDLLVTITGRLGTALVYTSEKPANLSAHVARVKVHLNKVNPYYLAAYLNSNFGKQLLNEHSIGSLYPHINVNGLQTVQIIIPPKYIQDLIAQIIQSAYSEYQEKLLESQNLILGIQEYVVKVIGIKNVLPASKNWFLISQSQLNRFDVRYFLPFYTQLEKIIENAIYPTKTLSEICIKIVNGLTPSKDGYTENGCVVIKVSSLTKDWRIEWKKVAFTSRTFFDKAKKAYIKDGDLLILSASHQLDYIGGSFGLVRDIPIEYLDQCMAVGELIIVRANHKIVLPEYLLTCFIIKPIQELINRMSRGQTAHLYAEDLQHLRVPIPPMKIQQLIVDELNRRRNEAKRLHTEAENLLTESKARVERIILGEEEVT